MKGATIEIVAEALVARVAPKAVAVVGSGGTDWVDAFAAHGVDDVRVIDTDLRSPFLEPLVDLAVSIGAGDDVPADVAPIFVASLCASAEVVAFAAALPGLAPDDKNARWPAWWDSLFEQHGFVAHDVMRPAVWQDDRVELLVRQNLVLYARPGRFEPSALPDGVARSVVHPEAHQRSLDLAGRRHQLDVSAANVRIAELDTELGRLDEQLALVTGDLQAERDRLTSAFGEERDGLTAIEAQLLAAEMAARDGRADAALLWSALAATHRELAAASNLNSLLSLQRARSDPKAAIARAVSGALPMRRGLRRVLGPSAVLFDEHFYVTRYPDVVASALSPLWHYRRHGARAGRSPHPFFDPAWYAERYAAAVDGDPMEDYLRRGWREGRDPHPLFMGSWYASQQSIGGSSGSPLEHYLEHGAAAGASPHPLIDPAWYLEQNPDLAAAGVDAVGHFLLRGWWEGRSPHPLFDVRWYLERYEHVAYEGINPLVDYLTRGWREDRDPHPLFDASWYLEAYPDVADAGLEPLSHFVMHGAAEGRVAGPLFDTAWYVATHPEAAADGRNPLEFFVMVGAARGDAPTPWAD